MADELEKKPKPIGTPAPNYPKPKQESASASAPAPKLDRQKSASFGKVKVKPGSPNMPESVPVGVQQTKFESPKHVEKRVNKMFKDTNQPTLGIWNKNNKNPMAEPNGIRFNPKLDYKPSKEALEAANRKKIMQAGFAPKDWNLKDDEEAERLTKQADFAKSLKDKVSPVTIKELGRAGISSMEELKEKFSDPDFKLNARTATREARELVTPNPSTDISQSSDNFYSSEKPKAPEIGSKEYEKEYEEASQNLMDKSAAETPKSNSENTPYDDKERRYVLNGMKRWFGLDPDDWHNQDEYLPEQGFDGDLMMEAYKQADEENNFDTLMFEDEVWEAVESKYNELFEQKYPNGMPKDDDVEEQTEQPQGDTLSPERINEFKEAYEQALNPFTKNKEEAFEKAMTWVFDDDLDYDSEDQLREMYGLEKTGAAKKANYENAKRELFGTPLSKSESDERSKASELYGTDLNKQQGYNYDSLSKKLDSGDWVNLDAGLLPYEYGVETNGYEDLAVDARKNPETGKYEVFMYPETEDGPVEEPDENYPNYEFDSFDDLKAFMENNYKKVEKPKWDPVNEPGSGGVTKELVDFVREQLKADGGLNDNFIDAYLSKMPQNSNQADYWKGKYQEAWNKKYGGGNK